eukprot:361005-Chlamydomonas_euryale.AAC.1
MVHIQVTCTAPRSPSAAPPPNTHPHTVVYNPAPDVHAPHPQSARFPDLLRALPESGGVLAELARSSTGLWRMARLAARWAAMPGAVNVKYEQLQVWSAATRGGALPGAVSSK